jgi:hypothetical protein
VLIAARGRVVAFSELETRLGLALPSKRKVNEGSNHLSIFN